MPLFFQIQHPGKSELGYRLDVLPENSGVENTKALLKETALMAGRVKKMHQAYAGDGRLQGQERVDLVAGLDRLFIDLVEIRDRLLAGNGGGREHKVPIERHNNKYSSRGALLRSDLAGIPTFGEFYQQQVLAQLRDLLLKLQENGAATGTSSRPDRESAVRTVDDILYAILLVRYGVENLLLDN